VGDSSVGLVVDSTDHGGGGPARSAPRRDASRPYRSDGPTPGQGGSVGQDQGEFLSIAGAKRVTQARLNVRDVVFELACNGVGA
jgi:hypothetical protein